VATNSASSDWYSRLQKAFLKFKEHPQVKQASSDFEDFIRSLRASLDHRLFDGKTDFWAYHLGGIAVLFIVDLAVNVIMSPAFLWPYLFFTSSVWSIGFFFSGLVLRQHYKNANWESQAQVLVLLKSIACSIFFAFLIVLVVSITSLFLYYDDIYHYRGMQTPGVSHISFVVQLFMRYWVVSTIYLVLWMMLYIGITSRRKTKQIEVANLRLQNSLKEAELSSLSNQLNPHFLFNALNNIRFMIQEDANNAEKMLMSLSSVLRYSLESSKQENVALEQELEISQRYIDIIQIQFEERLKFKCDISPNLEQCQMPPMVLQMLLENAVKHGIENIRSGGVIEVTAKLHDTTLLLTVWNDLPPDYEISEHDGGIGLMNIEQRLALLYGGRAKLETGIEEQRFFASITLPQNQQEHQDSGEDE